MTGQKGNGEQPPRAASVATSSVSPLPPQAPIPIHLDCLDSSSRLSSIPSATSPSFSSQSPPPFGASSSYPKSRASPSVKSELSEGEGFFSICQEAPAPDSQLPPTLLSIGQAPKIELKRLVSILFSPPVKMASMATVGAPSGSNSKQIPLLCTVCPETPRFSDVSHLLTHIASKGHLHHETQTKLKAHQDISASVALQQYEQWYRENGIEALLVERMRVKQLKEAAKNKRSRAASVAAPLKAQQAKKKIKRPATAHQQSDSGNLGSDYQIYPGFIQPGQENELADEFFANDMMALKGQVWPGMGKMDLANEDMKRTRNQRKPSSVIERMRRTSEGIEPTQVVMTPNFEVERIKDVYDSSSPIPGQEEATPPKKVTKPRRKRPEPLVEVPSNIPQANRRLERGAHGPEKMPKSVLAYSRTSSSEITPSLGQFKRNFNVFRDEDAMPVFDDRHISNASHRDPKFDLHGRIGLRQLNPISHSAMVSPTPSSRDMPERSFPPREMARSRIQGQSYLGMNGHMALGSMTPDMSYTMHDSPMYNNTARMSLNTGNHFNSMDHFQLPPQNQGGNKFEDFSHVSSGEPVPGTIANQFIDVSGAGSMFPHDRLFLGSCGQSGQSSNFPPLGFTPINRSQEMSHSMQGDQDRQMNPGGVKLEPPFCELMENSNAEDNKDSNFGVGGLWENQAPENDIGISDDLHHEPLEI